MFGTWQRQPVHRPWPLINLLGVQNRSARRIVKKYLHLAAGRIDTVNIQMSCIKFGIVYDYNLEVKVLNRTVKVSIYIKRVAIVSGFMSLEYT